jgi:hypothetical protein
LTATKQVNPPNNKDFLNTVDLPSFFWPSLELVGARRRLHPRALERAGMCALPLGAVNAPDGP